MEYKIRRAIPSDERKIRELFIEMLQTIYHTQDVQGYEPGFLDRYWAYGEDTVYVAEDNDVVAYLSVEVHREDEDDFVYLDDLSVTEKYRGHGIGSALIREAENYAKEIGIMHIFFMLKNLIPKLIGYTKGLAIKYTKIMETDI